MPRTAPCVSRPLKLLTLRVGRYEFEAPDTKGLTRSALFNKAIRLAANGEWWRVVVA